MAEPPAVAGRKRPRTSDGAGAAAVATAGSADADGDEGMARVEAAAFAGAGAGPAGTGPGAHSRGEAAAAGGAGAMDGDDAEDAAPAPASRRRRLEKVEPALPAFKPAATSALRAVPGRVRRVEMKNLRCHRNAVTELHERVNFIIGANGSGKSSILTAIRLALGMQLPRSGGADALISRDGDGTAVVNVDFSNEGEGHLDVRTFGRWFQVRRTMTRRADGSMSDKYEVLREGSEKVAVTKTEMLARFEDLHMWWDNPVLIMDQEASKKFFTGNSRTLFRMFADATGLSRDHENIIRLVEEVTTWQAHMKAANGKLAEARALVEEKKVERDRLEKVQRRLTDLRVLEGEVLWAELRERQKATAAVREEVSKKRESLDKVLKIAEQAKAKTADLDRQVLEAQAAADEAEKELDAAKSRIEDLGERLTKATEEQASARVTESGARKALDSVAARIATLERNAMTLEARVTSNDTAKKRAMRQRAIDDARAAKDRAEAEEATAKRDLRAAEEAIEPLREARDRAVAAHNDVRGELEAANEALARQTATARSSITPLDAMKTVARSRSKEASAASAMVSAHERMTAAGSSGTLTKGFAPPAWMAGRVDPRWENALLRLGPMLQFYTVDPVDSRRMAEVARGSSIRFAMMSCPAKRLEPGTGLARFMRLTDVLTIDDAWAHCLAMNELNLDRVLLSESRDDAVKTLRSLSSNESNLVLHVLVRNGQRVSLGKAGSVTTRSDPASFPPGVLQPPKDADLATTIADTKETIARLSMEERSAAETAAATTRSVSLAEAALHRATSAVAAAGKNMRARTAALRAAEDVPEPAADTVDSAELEQELSRLADARSRRDDAAKAVAAAGERVRARTAEVAARQAELEAAQRQVHDNAMVKEVHTRLKAALDRLNEHRLRILRSRDLQELAMAEFSEAEGRLADAEAQDAAREAVVRATTHADKSTMPELTMAAATSKVNGLKRTIEAESKEHNKTPEEVESIQADYLAAAAVLEKQQEETARVQLLLERMRKEKKDAEKCFIDLRNQLQQRVTSVFRDYMRDRGSDGVLEWIINEEDPASGELIVKIAPDRANRYGDTMTQSMTQADDDHKAGRGILQLANTLSGGEKSVATMTLLAAISHFAPVPFRAYDEFDVFQDEAARKTSLRMLLELSTKPSADGVLPQYLLLTPHDIKAVVTLNSEAQRAAIRVVRLKDPTRGGRGAEEAGGDAAA